ncbi:MAG: DNA repair exonuclease [Clostridia bacterium]|nr:DNA repair exonuclease [Clostridia bacterium]
MLFVHTADNHLDMPLGSLPPHKALIRRQSRLSSFSKIIDYTLACGDMLLISGDLFDTSCPSASVVRFCTEQFKRLGDIPVFISLGNHDHISQSFNFPENVHLFPSSPETVTYKNYTITGVSFASPSADFAHIIPPASQKDRFNILCIHGDTLTQSEYNAMNKDKLFSLGYDYVALGHIHEFSRYKTIVYPGCHDGGGFDETGEKFFVACRVENKLPIVEKIPSSSLVYRSESFDISQYSSSDEIGAALCEKFPQGIYKFSLTGTPAEGFVPNISLIQDYICEYFFHATVEDCSDTKADASTNMLYKIFSDYVQSSCIDEEVSRLALHYGACALKGEIDV